MPETVAEAEPESVAEERRWQYWSDVAWYAEHDAMTRVLQCILMLNGAEGAARHDVQQSPVGRG